MPLPQRTKRGNIGSAGTGTPATTGTSNSTPPASTPCGCGCHDHAVESCACCKLTRFERPKYFCGQLLSDADLTLQETYFREKNKLYHRTMDGFGVVCGLRMTRDVQCKGHILIGDGYAIDACGNDLVVCDPRSFNVIAELRRNNWLVEMPKDRARGSQSTDDARQSGSDDDENCISRQCFYIGICYAEEPVNFATPYTTECNPAPGPCQPTRIREGVRFEIYDSMPVRPNPLDEVGKRIESCFRIFREGQFSRSLASMTDRIIAVLRDDNVDSNETKPKAGQELFKELQAQFLHELRTCPDQYNCDIEREVYRILPPDKTRDGQGAPPLEAFTRLFELIQKYVFSCVLAQLAFSCPEPPDARCVLIGSVEIENGCLTRVINYPRWYLWCFGNFFQVLLYTMANDGACGKDSTTRTAKAGHDGQMTAKNGCCPPYEVDVSQFLNLFSADHRALEKAARTPVDAIQASYSALVAGFNFTRAGGVAPSVLRNLDLTTAGNLTQFLGVNFEPSTGQEAERTDVFAAIADNTIRFRSETLVYDTDDSKDEAGNTVTQVSGIIGAPAYAVGPFTSSMFKDLLERLTSVEERLSNCESKLGGNGRSQTSPASGTPTSNTPPPNDKPQGDQK
jgi:hypothetical protein